MNRAEADVPRLVPSVTPYHPKELGAKNADERPTICSGLLGVLWMFVVVFATIVIFIGASPFLLLGSAEVVIDYMPGRWRIRWVRRAEVDRG